MPTPNPSRKREGDWSALILPSRVREGLGVGTCGPPFLFDH